MSAHEDEMYARACAHVLKSRVASVPELQSAQRLAYDGAVAFLERMQADGIVSAPDAAGKRTVIKPGALP